jgi:hypothetical protein
MFGTGRMLLRSFLASFSVLACILVLQWLVYRDLLHEKGPLHLIGGTMAAVLTFAFMLRWQGAARDRQQEMLKRFQTIADMNDRIRNALQVIECTTYATNPETAEHVRQAVMIIDRALEGVIAHPGIRPAAIERTDSKTSSAIAGSPSEPFAGR